MRAFLYLAAAMLAAGAAESAAYDPSAVAWTRLELEASKFFLTARSVVELAGRPSAEAIAELLSVPPAPVGGSVPAAHSWGGDQAMGLAPRGGETFRVDIRTRMLSRNSRIRFWFDPGDARALQRVSHDLTRKKLRHRTYRYTRGGVFSRTLRPTDGERDRPYIGWSGVTDQVFAFAADVGGAIVTEPAALLYLIPAGSFRAPGDRERLRVFTRGRVRQVDVTVTARERIDVDYVEVSVGGERLVKGDVEALKVQIRPHAEAGEDQGGFKLLGLEGDIDIYLEPQTRALLLMRGKVDFAGTVRLRLKRAALR